MLAERKDTGCFSLTFCGKREGKGTEMDKQVNILVVKKRAVLPWERASQVALKNSPANAGDTRGVGSIPGLGRSPGGGHGNPLQYSCLQNPMDRRAWRATVHGVTRSRTRLKPLSTIQVTLGKHCHVLDLWVLLRDDSLVWLVCWWVLGGQSWV